MHTTWLSYRQAAKAARRGESTIRAWKARGLLHTRKVGVEVYVHRESLMTVARRMDFLNPKMAKGQEPAWVKRQRDAA